jgi:hypothetical protein
MKRPTYTLLHPKPKPEPKPEPTDADLEALSVTRATDLAPDDLPPVLPMKPPKPDKKIARVPRAVRRLVGTPTKEQIAEFFETMISEDLFLRPDTPTPHLINEAEELRAWIAAMEDDGQWCLVASEL